ncbi:unnamed protein product, partial [marine sediment metagenome]
MEKAKHGRLPRWIQGPDLIERWNINNYELADFVRNCDLAAYDDSERITTHQRERWKISAGLMHLYVLKGTDVEQFENEHPELRPKKASEAKSLTPKDARELGQL